MPGQQSSAIKGLPGDEEGRKRKGNKNVLRSGAVTLARKGGTSSQFELENNAPDAAGVSKVSFDAGDVKTVLAQGCVRVLQQGCVC